MNGAQFDELTRALASHTSRRQAIRALLGGTLAGLLPSSSIAQDSPPIQPREGSEVVGESTPALSAADSPPDPARTPSPGPAQYCWNVEGRFQGPADAPTPFLYRPFDFREVPPERDITRTFGWIWKAQMDHTRPNYHVDNRRIPDGRMDTLGEKLSYQNGGTQAYPDYEVHDSSIPPSRLGRILGYRSPSLETFLFYDGHDGHDFAYAGTALATAAGVVTFAGVNQSTLGRVVEIYHPEGYLTRYAHLAAIMVERGDQIDEPGTPIGTIGGSAYLNGQLLDGHWGTHLHFSVFRWSQDRGAWQITDPFGWDPWKSPGEQTDDPLVLCNGEVSYNLWFGWWPRPHDGDSEEGAGNVQAAASLPLHGEYLGGSFVDDGAPGPVATSLPAGFTGQWTGQGTQTNPPRTWPIAITLTGGEVGEAVGTVDYPADPCRGELTLASIESGTDITVAEAITDGPCLDGGTFRLTLLDAGRLEFHWSRPQDTTVAEGVLTREAVVPMPTPGEETGNDVSMFRGNAARTGEMPGPGPDDTNGIAAIWTFDTGGLVSSSPAVVDGVIYVGSGENHIYALDATTGDERWRFQTGGPVDSSPAVVDGAVYVGSYDNHVYALDAATGSECWRFQTGNAVYSSPAVAGGIVYVGSNDSHLYALDATTGEQRWRFQTAGNMFSSPALAGGVVFVGSQDGNVYALDGATGSERWRSAIDGGVSSSPAVADGAVYVGSYDGNVYALDAATGGKRWQVQTGDSAESSPAVADGVVYIGGWGYYVHAFDAATGTERWTFQTTWRMTSSQAVIDGVVYIGSWDGHVYAIGDAGEETLPAPAPSLAGLTYVSAEGDLWLIGEDSVPDRIVKGLVNSPAWSRDGTRMAYVRWLVDGYPNQIEVVNADGMKQIVIVPPRENLRMGGDIGYQSYHNLRWAPNDTALYYSHSIGLRGGNGIIRHDLSTGGEEDVVIPEVILGAGFDLAIDGSLAALGSPVNADASTYNLYLLDNSGRMEILRSMPGGGGYSGPAWSPNGSLLAMAVDGDGLLLIDRNGNEVQHLVNDSGNIAGDITWSPDGTIIAYASNSAFSGDVTSPIWTVPAIGGSPTEHMPGSEPAWRPVEESGTNPDPPGNWQSGTWEGVTVNYPPDHWFSESVPPFTTLADFHAAASIYPESCPTEECPRLNFAVSPANGLDAETWAIANGFLGGDAHNLRDIAIDGQTGIAFETGDPSSYPGETTFAVFAFGAEILIVQDLGADPRIVDSIQLAPGS